MLRALTILALTVLGTQAHAQEPPPCPDKQYVIDYMLANYPGTTYEPITGLEASAVKAAIRGADATEFLVFAKPGADDRRMIVGFKDGCLEDAAPVTQGTIDRWKRGQESAR